MALSKKGATGIIILILLVGLGMFLLAPADDPPTEEDPENNNETMFPEPEGGTTNIDMEGFTTAEDGEVTLTPELIANNHRSKLLNNSVDVSYKTANGRNVIKKFGNRIIHTEYRTFSEVRKYTDGVITYQVTGDQDQQEYFAEKESISDSVYHQHSFHNSLLKDLEIDEVSQNEDGDVALEMSSSDNLENLNTALSDISNLNEADATVNISSNGVITSVNMDVLGEGISGIPRSSEYNYTVNQISEVEVSEPPWVSKAKQRTSLIKSTPDTENNWVKIDHEGLAPIESGSTLRILASSGNTDRIEINNTLSSGDTFYIAPKGENNWTLSINEEPDNEGSIEFSEGSEIIVDIVNDVDGEQITYYSESILLQS